jgi:Bifunctional DNA primase/polymerase, N-terminal/AAA domain
MLPNRRQGAPITLESAKVNTVTQSNDVFADLNEAEALLTPEQLIAIIASEGKTIRFQPIDARRAEIGKGVIALSGGNPYSAVCENNRMIALRYAEAGIAIFPISAAARKPNGKLAKKVCGGMSWPSVSTTDRETIIDWWKKWPDALVGIDMAKSGLIGIDADRHDPKKDGVEALKDLEIQYDVLPEHPITLTANNGEHRVFRQRDGERLGLARGALPAGFFDVRGDGGYIVAPSTITGADGDWRADPEAPDLIESFKAGTIPVLPDWLATIIKGPKGRQDIAPCAPEPRTEPLGQPGTRQQRYAQKALEANCRELASMPPESGRNNALNSIGYRMGRMIERGWIERGTVEAWFWHACQSNGLLNDDGRRQVLATIKSSIEAGIKNPIGDLKDRGRPATPLPDYGVKFDADGSMYDGSTGVVVEGLPPGFKLAYDDVPEASDLIKDLLPKQQVFFIGGQTQAGKTYIAVHMAYCLASVTAFFSHRIKERVGSVFLVAEGAATFYRRMRLACEKMGCDRDQPVSYFGSPQPYLSDDKGVEALIPQLKSVSMFYQDAFDVRLGAIFIDTVAAGFNLDDENDNSEAAQAITRMRRLSDETGALA